MISTRRESLKKKQKFETDTIGNSFGNILFRPRPSPRPRLRHRHRHRHRLRHRHRPRHRHNKKT